MKLVPAAITRKIASQQLLAHENAPKILFVGGVVSMVGSTVLACRATLKVGEVLEQIENDQNQANSVHELVNDDEYEGDASYSDKELKKDQAVIVLRGAGRVAKLYAPAVILGGVGVLALTKSHRILQDRNLALAAAYTAVEGAYARYRDRVRDRYGEDVDREFYYESEVVQIVDEETGNVTETTQVTGAPGSAYARWYDKESSRNWSVDPDINMMFLKNVQNVANDRLRSRGHLFLNEVYQDLGLTHTTAGAVVGWRWNKNSGDDFVDFGIWDSDEKIRNFFNGREGAILLDFNVDGMIHELIELDPA